MGKIIFVILVLAFVAYSYRPRFVETAHLTRTPSSAKTENECFYKRKCVAVYLAPWCPACQKTTEIVKELKADLKNSPDIEVIAVVGSDSQAKIQQMAEQIGENTYMDLDGSFGNSAGVKSLPTWLVVTPAKKIIKKHAGTYSNVAKMREVLELN